MPNTACFRLRNPRLHLATWVLMGLTVPAAYAEEGAQATPATPSSVAATPSAGPVRGSSVTHTIQQGETLDGVCRKFKIAAANCLQISYFNKLENNRLPAPGMVVYVPLSLLPFKPEQARLIQTAGKVQINGQEARAGVRLDENTRITAEADSSAVVELADGSRLKILPSSVADIVHSRTYTAPESTSGGKFMQWIGSKIRLIQGAVESAVKKKNKTGNADSKPVEVETVTSLIGVRGTQFRVAAADRFVPFDRAEVLEGSVSNINTWKNSEIALNGGQGAVVDPNKTEMQAIPLLPPPTVPEKGQILRRPNAYWSFSPAPGAVAYRVIAASDPTFNDIRFSEKNTLPQADLSRLENGVWHLRARAVDAQGLEGLDATSAIELRQPAWLLRNPSVQNRQGRLHLSWTAVSTADFEALPGATTVKIDLASEGTFSTPLASLQSAGNELVLPKLGPGRYHLRIGVDNAVLKNDEQQFFVLEVPASTYDMGYNLLLQGTP